jgi:glycosyltransferase involved in cell wall biosynthesis
VRLADQLTRWSRWGVVLSAVSESAAAPIRAVVGPDVDVRLIPNGIDVADWRAAHVAGDPDEVRLVAVMRLAPRKRAMPLVRMAHEAAGRLPAGRRLRLTIVGDGPLTSQVQRYVAKHGLQHGVFTVDLAGRLSHDHVRATLAASDVFVAPARMESFGIAALEARTVGLPVLAYSSTGITSFVRHEVEGLLADDDPAMVAALVRIASDDDLRTRIAEHNQSVDPDEAWPHVLALVETAYADAATR